MFTLIRPENYDASRVESFTGLSTDTKPLNCKNGAEFIEIDTSNIYRFDEENNLWIKGEGIIW